MELHEDSSSGFKIFTISTTTLSVIIVNSVFLHDPWYHPEDYPKYYGLFYTSVYTLLYCMWTWAYIITLSAPRKPPKSMIVKYK
jgi:DHHC palmitoyltransferase